MTSVSWSRWPSPTRRGVGFLLAGILAVLLAHAWSVPVLVQVGGVLVAAPVLAMLVVALGRPAWDAERDVEPRVVEPGDAIAVHVRLLRRGRSALDVVEWWEDASGGGHSGLLLDEGHGRPPGARYEMRLSQRGRHRIGPTSVRVSDPFGLATRWVELPGESSVVVLPRRVPLSTDSALLDVLGDRDQLVEHAASARGLGEPDVLARPYRFGDAVKRLHWKATAHRGSLMVRQEEQQSRRRVALVVDTRASDERALDWRASAAASVLDRLHRDGAELRLVVDEVAADVPPEVSPREALIALALAAPGGTAARLEETAADVVVFAGRIDLATARDWLASPARSAAIAFVDAASDAEAVELLRREGWTCLRYRDRDDLAQLWDDAEVRPWQ